MGGALDPSRVLRRLLVAVIRRMAREAAADRDAEQGLAASNCTHANTHAHSNALTHTPTVVQQQQQQQQQLQVSTVPKKPIRLKNVSNHFETFDTLHHNAKTVSSRFFF